METTLILVKPDAFTAKNTGAIIAMFEDKGFNIEKAWVGKVTEEFAGKHYAELSDKPFYPELKLFLSNGKLMALVFSKENAVADARSLIGTTNPAEWKEGTIRKRFGTSLQSNAVHGSDKVESAKKEIALWFP